MSFVAARCPQCNGDLQLDNEKDTGFCMYCGSKIIVQEAIMSVRLDNSFMIEKWMKAGDLAAEGGNLSEAYELYRKIVETQPDNWQAIYKKGKAAGWQSTLENVRFIEAATCFGQAINLAPEGEKEKLKFETAEEVQKLGLALISLRSDRFIRWPDEDEAKGFLGDLSNILDAVYKLDNKSGFLITGFMEPIASTIIPSVITAWNEKIIPDYLGEENHPGNFEFKKYIEQIGFCTTLLEQAISLSDHDDKEDIRGLETLITLQNEAINSCSWEYEINEWGTYWYKDRELTETAKQYRRNLIAHYREKIAQIKTKLHDEEEANIREKERKEAEERQRRIDDYWSMHQIEKAQLKEEKYGLLEQISWLEKEKEKITMVFHEKQQTIQARTQKIRDEQKALGLFKVKEKKALQDQIDCAENVLVVNKAKLEELQNPIVAKINCLQERLKQIDTELTMKR